MNNKNLLKKIDFAIAVIKWDQRKGGIIQEISPPIKIPQKTSMNIYNLHRVKSTEPSFGSLRMKLENGEEFNLCSFFSGYGATTHPDGFTGNFSKYSIGTAERVVCLFLPTNLEPEKYELVLAKIASRLLMDPYQISAYTSILGEKLASIEISDAKSLLNYLENNIDDLLGLNLQQIINAYKLELRILYQLNKEKDTIIKELTINPVKSALVCDEQKIADAEMQRKQIQQLIKQITEVSMQKNILELKQSEKDMIIEQLKSDYVKIFGTLTDQINLLEAEINGITESTQALVNDLNQVLAEKINRIKELEAEIQQLKSSKQTSPENY
ncbi:MAG: hypothetical protein ACTSRZ_10160 [Promethearchaeota archaeon]